jgi:Tol biopolymer transport system component
MPRVLGVAVAGAIAVGLLAAPGPAQRGTFPGPNGLLVFGAGGGSIAAANVDGSNRHIVVQGRNGLAAYEPAWSADGNRVAFANKSGNGGGIMYANADGSGLTRVTSNVNDGEPAWSPDATRLAYISVQAGRRRLVVSNLDGTGLTVLTLTLERSLDDPEWSPDGTRIAFSDSVDVYVVNADGSGLVNLTGDPTQPGAADYPSWSPDGSRIAYKYLSSIRVIPSGGGASATVVAGLGEVWEVTWSPDGTKIAFVNDARGPLQEELYVVNADGTGLTAPGLDLQTTLDWGRTPTAPPPPPPAPPPVSGVSVNVTPVSGVVRVRLRGTTSFVDLTALSSVPVGSEVDVTRGRIRLVTAAGAGKSQTGDFFGGRALIAQTRSAALTTLKLSEPLSCPKRKTSSVAAPKRTRRLWGDVKGRFKTSGRYAAASVRGTRWLTEDRCDRTIVRVRIGRVEVQDLVRRRSVLVRAGQSYVARARP